MKTYAGIGSRETPAHVLNQMNAIAVWLQGEGFTLRSGGAAGADTAFERGAGVKKEIYRPEHANAAALALASVYHPAVLGADLESPSAFVVCWTKDGGASGGTGQAIRIAEYCGIPVFNLHDATAEARLRAHVSALQESSH